MVHYLPGLFTWSFSLLTAQISSSHLPTINCYLRHPSLPGYDIIYSILKSCWSYCSVVMNSHYKLLEAMQ